MFVDEARISSNLHHKNIVQVFDFGEVDGQYYLTMEYIDGSNLKNLFFRTLKQNKFLPREMIYYVILKTASALDYAHKVKIEGQLQSMQLVHRDVSPQNILISKLGDVKITDFGIAKAVIKISQTQPGKIQGKYSYMSPEQALGRPLNYQSDIFSLGIVFYELLTAKKVYGSSETIKRYTEATKANIPRIGTILEDLPSQIDTLVTRMVAKNPEDRPKDCTEIIDTLAEFLSASSDEVLSAQLGSMVKDLFPESTVLASSENIPTSFDQSHIQVGFKSAAIPELIRTIKTDRDTPSAYVKWIQRFAILSLLVLLGVAGWKYNLYRKSVQKPVVVEAEKNPENDDTPPSAQPDTSKENEETQNLVQDMEVQIGQLDNEIEIVQAELHRSDVPTVKVKQPTTVEQDDTPPAPPPSSCPTDMVKIEAGDFMMGSNDSERNDLVETQAHSQSFKKFCVDRYEYPNQKDAAPARNVSLSEARQMCENNHKRLCSEIEWERACKGPGSLMTNQQYSYGPTWVDGACNIKNFNSMMDDKTGEVATSGEFTECTTNEGVHDLNGNVQEWTSSKGHFQNDDSKYIVKGGSFQTPKFQSRCSSFLEESPMVRKEDMGFRCCKEP